MDTDAVVPVASSSACAIVGANAPPRTAPRAYEMATPLNRMALLADHAAVVVEIQNKQNRLAAYRYYKQETANLDVEQLEFGRYLCVSLLEKGTVDVDGTVTFRFLDGSEREIASSP